ncbi:hypothetical protein ACUUL3_04105 [Thiovibrio sp. JS02]
MALPPLVHYETVAEYREHYENIYCRGIIYTSDGIRVYFSAAKFGHVFYESSARDGGKDVFSPVRAQRIDWIRATLEHPEAYLFQGWNKKTRLYDETRRVAVVYEDFVVVIALSLKRDNSLKANFITCYQAENSIGVIRRSPFWSREGCLLKLAVEPGGVR